MEDIKRIDLNKREIITTENIGFTHKDFVAYFKEGYIIDNFVGGVEVPIEEIKATVSTDFSASSIIDKDEKKIQVDWKTFGSYITSLDGKTALLRLGKTDSNGNRKEQVKDKELREWVKVFGIDNILTKSDYVALLRSDKYTKETKETEEVIKTEKTEKLTK